ncbi:hypothetical protein PG990_012124 [Apiospora arundinis]|uniref:Uncharacterized protein n=1 Tax=Apiospora arundinis TaxID=335852 RepID=A0ABR2HQ92_9PEZI
MKLLSVILLSCSSAYAVSLSSLFERTNIDVCGWHLNGNDCICMNSQNGALLQVQTNTCCNNMGLQTRNAICTVAHDNRDTFKQCCKWLNQESVIGHCR